MAGYATWQSCRLQTSRFVSAVLTFNLVLIGQACFVAAGNTTSDTTGDTISDKAVPYQLEVILNGVPTNLVGAFYRLPNGRFASTRGELTELSIETAGAGGPGDMVPLDSIDGLSYLYNEEEQRIDLTIRADGFRHRSYSADRNARSIPRARADPGFLLNYGLYASMSEDDFQLRRILEGFSASLEARLFGPYGTLDTTGIIGTSQLDSLRLDTTWTYSLPSHLLTMHAGDIISGGLGATRPIRMGGVQLQRNFALRPDLITRPLPTVTGSAAVPSTVDVYVNNIKTYSQDVPGGPFTITRLPVITGSGTARVVVRDASGRETVEEVSFFSSPHLLQKNFLDFSLEAGFARLSYGEESNDYDPGFVASGTVEYGLTDHLTISGHAEGGFGMVNVGAGFATQVGSFGVATAAANVSTDGGATGSQVYAGFELDFDHFNIVARSQRSFGAYTDLAAMTIDAELAGLATLGALSNAPDKAIDFIGVGLPVRSTGGNLNLGFLHREDADGDTSDIANISYTQRLSDTLSFNASGFHDFGHDTNTGIHIGLSMTLGKRESVSLGASYDDDEQRLTGTYTRSADRKPGSAGWRVSASTGETIYGQADAEYYGETFEARGGLSYAGGNLQGSGYLNGAVVVTGGDVLFSRHIADSFAVVDAGAPNVEVRQENRLVGVTNENGRLLVPGLRAYEVNKIAIDPEALPLNAQIGNTQAKVVPRERSGVSVKFDVDTNANVAVVEFRDAGGVPIATGSGGTVVQTGEEFVVGYDGQAFIAKLAARNRVEIRLGDRTCHAGFAFKPSRTDQVFIEAVTCR